MINKVLSMSWNNLMCLDYFNLKAMSLKVGSSNLLMEILSHCPCRYVVQTLQWKSNFIKILALILNKISKFWQTKK